MLAVIKRTIKKRTPNSLLNSQYPAPVKNAINGGVQNSQMKENGNTPNRKLHHPSIQYNTIAPG
jgi:hypothetical protein